MPYVVSMPSSISNSGVYFYSVCPQPHKICRTVRQPRCVHAISVTPHSLHQWHCSDTAETVNSGSMRHASQFTVISWKGKLRPAFLQFIGMVSVHLNHADSTRGVLWNHQKFVDINPGKCAYRGSWKPWTTTWWLEEHDTECDAPSG